MVNLWFHQCPKISFSYVKDRNRRKNSIVNLSLGMSLATLLKKNTKKNIYAKKNVEGKNFDNCGSRKKNTFTPMLVLKMTL